MKKIFKNNAFSQLLPLLILALLINFSLDMRSRSHYQDKMNIIKYMLQTEKDARLDTAAELLKSESADLQEGQDILDAHGYTDSARSRYYQQFLRECTATAVCTVLVLLLVLAIIRMRESRLRTAQEEYFRQLGQCLVKFREGDDSTGPFPCLEGCETAAGRVNGQLEMLARYLAQMREQAYEERENTKKLVTDISHQLKTPVAALDICYSLLEDPALSSQERQEFQHRCRDELDGLKMLLDSLIQISRMETGILQIVRRKALLPDTIAAAVNRIYPKASDKQMTLSVDYGEGAEQLAVMQDTEWLCEAFINILDNAVKYSPPESEIKIRIQPRIRFVKIEITDQGIGIPKQEYHKIFKRFYRGSNRQIRRENGSGVGLYLAREIIEKHHGTIMVKSDYEKKENCPGSRFEIQLPI